MLTASSFHVDIQETSEDIPMLKFSFLNLECCNVQTFPLGICDSLISSSYMWPLP